MTNRGDTLAPQRTAHPRHKAIPAGPGSGLRRPGLAAAVRRVTAGRLDRASIPAGTGGVAGGLAAASIGAVVTIMIANSGHAAVRPHLTVPVTRMAADMPSRHMPRPVYHPRTVARRKRHRAGPDPQQQLAAGQRPATASPLSGITNGLSWQDLEARALEARALEARAGLPPWAQRMVSAWGQAVARRDSSAGQAPAQGGPDGQPPVPGADNGQPPSWP